MRKIIIKSVENNEIKLMVDDDHFSIFYTGEGTEGELRKFQALYSFFADNDKVVSEVVDTTTMFALQAARDNLINFYIEKIKDNYEAVLSLFTIANMIKDIKNPNAFIDKIFNGEV